MEPLLLSASAFQETAPTVRDSLWRRTLTGDAADLVAAVDSLGDLLKCAQLDLSAPVGSSNKQALAMLQEVLQRVTRSPLPWLKLLNVSRTFIAFGVPICLRVKCVCVCLCVCARVWCCVCVCVCVCVHVCV